MKKINLKGSSLFKQRTGADHKSSETQKEITQFIASLFLPIMVIAFCMVSARYFLRQRDYNKKVIVVSEQAKDTATNNLQNIESLKSDFSKLESGDYGSKEILDALPSKYDYLALITSLEKLISQSGLTVVNIEGSDQTAEVEQSSINPEPQPMKVAVGAKGSYEEIQNFIDDLEKSIRPIQITNMRLSGEVNAMKLDLNITTYYQLSEDLKTTTEEISPDA